MSLPNGMEWDDDEVRGARFTYSRNYVNFWIDDDNGPDADNNCMVIYQEKGITEAQFELIIRAFEAPETLEVKE